MDKTIKPRVIMRVEISPTAVATIGNYLDKSGMTSVALHTRLIQWLVNQDERTQAAILGLPPAENFDVATVFLKKLAKKEV